MKSTDRECRLNPVLLAVESKPIQGNYAQTGGARAERDPNNNTGTGD